MTNALNIYLFLGGCVKWFIITLGKVRVEGVVGCKRVFKARISNKVIANAHDVFFYLFKKPLTKKAGERAISKITC